MTTSSNAEPSKPETGWGTSYRLIASEKWKAKSAVMGKAVTEALVEYAQPKLGMRVLDLASGTGEPAISLAARVGVQGHVTALDLSAELLAIAEKRAQERGLDNFSTRQADAQALPFAGNSFDLATCRFGVMFFRDAVSALQELRRVLRAESRACFLTWGPFDQPYWRSTMGVVHRHVGGPLLPPGGQIRSALPLQEAFRRCCRALASATYKKKRKHCPGFGRGRRKKCGSRRRLFRCRSGRCWIECPRICGRRFTLMCVRRSSSRLRERTSSLERRWCWPPEESRIHLCRET